MPPRVATATQQRTSPPAQLQEPSLNLAQALPQDAFAALGRRWGAEFRLAGDELWVGPEAAVRVTADLREVTFWQAVMALSEQTAYEPVFKPYGRNEQGQPILWLRRVDVRGEQKVAPAMAAGPLLLRATEARVTVDLKTAQLRMVPPQAAVRVEVFLEPNVSAVFVTAAALRAFDEEDAALRRAEGHDPTVGMADGVGELLLHLDVIKRVPLDIARWQALMRVVEAGETELLTAPVTVVPETRSHGLVVKPAATQPAEISASAPAATLPAAVPHDLGPYRVNLEAVRIGEREAGEGEAADGAPAPPRMATVQMIVPRGDLDHTSWSRFYGFLVSLPPGLAVERDAGSASPWRLTGYAIVSIPAADDPNVAGSFRVWAQFQAESGVSDPKWLHWALPVESSEERFPVVWEQSLSILAPATQPATRAKTPQKGAPAE